MLRTDSSIGMHEVGSYVGTRKGFMALAEIDGKPVNIDELAFLTVDAGADLKVSDTFERDGFCGEAVKIQRAPNVTIVGLRKND
ncbi:MAG: hypothetical protein M3160_10440 [Candidatus Eremiobacteraeota bacterium]|nr:hypothetical protein [Candidatus Eremiobacteraeota bacterium]